MLLLYVLLLAVLLSAGFLINLRVRSLEKQYKKVAHETETMIQEGRKKPGNAGKPDDYAYARHAYLLGQAVERRERVEAKYFAWQKRAEKLAAFVRAVREWKGKKLPYALGALDVVLVLGALDYLGYREALDTRHLVDYVKTLVNRA
jgi:hypothetical protein